MGEQGKAKTMTMDNQASSSLSAPFVVSGEVAGLRTAIGEKTAELCARDYARSLCAVVLTGSLARDEATWVREATGWRLLGDAEFLLVFEPRAALPPPPARQCLAQEIQDVLRRDGILGRVQLAPVYPKYLRRLQPHIFAYELRACGRVVWGDSSILSLIPPFSVIDIPLEDAWRLLANRMIEHLEAAAEVDLCGGSVPEGLRYRTVKLYLDMATSLLVFAGSYAPAYTERLRRLRILADTEPKGSWPFPLGPFAQQVGVSTDLKLSSEWRSGAEAGWDFWRQGHRYARLLWRWELARLANGRQTAADGELMRNWMRRQPFAQRLRGWLFVWRARGWLRSWQWWVRWARLAGGGSPRYWVYFAAHSLFRQLPEVLEREGHREMSRALLNEVASSLPVVRHSEAGGRVPGWAELVAEVAWNYHRFLEPTRA
jgi:hypothetical protein